LLVEVEHPFVDAAVRGQEEVFRLQALGGLIEDRVVEQDHAEDQPFGLDVARHRFV
jgi:hypothetical protein